MEWERRTAGTLGEWWYRGGGTFYLVVLGGDSISCELRQVPIGRRIPQHFSGQGRNCVPLIEQAIDDGWLTEYVEQAMALYAMGADLRAREVIGDALRRLINEP